MRRSLARQPRLHRLALVVLLGAGCERVGGPLVDHYEPPEPEGVIPTFCHTPPACDAAVPDFPDPHPEALRRVDVPTACAVRPWADCAAQPRPDDDDAGAGATVAGCRLELGASDLAAYDGADVTCSRLIVRRDGDAPALVRLRGVAWERMNVSLASETPFVLELAEAELIEVALELQGPITVRLVASSLRRVRVYPLRPQEAPLRVELERVDASALSIGGEPSFPGAVAITRSTVTGVQIVAAELVAESVEFTGGLIDVGALTATDSAFVALALDCDDGVLSVCRLAAMQVRDCGALALIGSEIDGSMIAPCRAPPLRVYSSSAVGSLFDGVVEADRSNFQAVRFGVRSTTEIALWGGGVLSTNFCAATGAVRLGAAADVRCSDCGAGLPDGAVCAEADSPSEPRESWCAAFERPSTCPDRRVRERPITSD